MRPRLHNTHLPKNVYISRGKYYLVRNKKWVPIGSTEAEALSNIQAMFYKTVHNHEALLAFALRLVAVARQNAKSKRRANGELPFSLSKEDIKALLDKCGWRCAVTGTPFSLQKIGKHSPFAPSIDRIDCSDGYHPDNCRMVCVAANVAMNVWGEGVLKVLAENMIRMLPNTQPNA
jgi:hypothetical protein